uniref:Uncharacterized protein n=1 Tax=Arundo donax TaxID=35708 RepID=A0A0A9GR69_ARUDO
MQLLHRAGALAHLAERQLAPPPRARPPAPAGICFCSCSSARARFATIRTAAAPARPHEPTPPIARAVPT